MSNLGSSADTRGERVLGVLVEALMELFSDSLLAQGTVDTDAILNTATSVIAKHLPVTCIGILMKSDPDMSRIVVADDVHPEMARFIEDYLAATARPREGPTAGFSQRVIEAGAPVYIPHMDTSQLKSVATLAGKRYLEAHAYPLNVQSVRMLMTPMRSGSAVMGTLGMFDWVGADSFDETDIDWMQRAADRVGLGIDNAQFRTRAEERLLRMLALNQLALALASSRDLNLAFHLIVESLIGMRSVECADIVLVDRDHSALSVAAWAGFKTEFPYLKLEMSSEAFNSVFAVESNVTSTDWMSRQRRSAISREAAQAYRALPLRASGGLVGAVELLNREDLDQDKEWEAFLETMACLAAFAIEQLGNRAALRSDQQSSSEGRRSNLRLNDRERRIIGLIVGGASNREIAEGLHLSQNTVKAYVRRILDKAEVANRTELAAKAVSQGWLQPL